MAGKWYDSKGGRARGSYPSLSYGYFSEKSIVSYENIFDNLHQK